MCRVNEFEAVLSLVSYYQMVSPSADDAVIMADNQGPFTP